MPVTNECIFTYKTANTPTGGTNTVSTYPSTFYPSSTWSSITAYSALTSSSFVSPIISGSVTSAYTVTSSYWNYTPKTEYEDMILSEIYHYFVPTPLIYVFSDELRPYLDENATQIKTRMFETYDEIQWVNGGVPEEQFINCLGDFYVDCVRIKKLAKIFPVEK